MNIIVQKIKGWFHPIMGLLGLNLVIIAHESGHFITAKLFGVGTPIFSIGFGPALLAIKLGQTTFQIAAIPFGGYVALDPASLAAQPYLHKIVIILAGVMCNILFAYFIFVFLALRGKYSIMPIITKVIPHSPADKAGLAVNDRILSFNHTEIQQDASEFLQTITQSPGKEITLAVEQEEGTTRIVTLTLGTSHPIMGSNVGWLGTQWKTIKTAQPSLLQSIVEGVYAVSGMIRNLGKVTSSVFRKGRNVGFTGPIGIIVMTGKSLALSPRYFAFILAVVSINVGLFNLLPIPFLDGGKAVQYTIEAFIGPIPAGIINYITIIFLILFLFLILSITMGDITRLRKNK